MTNKKELSFMEFRRISKREEGLFSTGQAADVLDVTQTRVDQLVKAGVLDHWEFMGKRYVSCAQVAARRDSDIKSGRPSRSLKQRVKLAGKMIRKTSLAQVAVDALP